MSPASITPPSKATPRIEDPVVAGFLEYNSFWVNYFNNETVRNLYLLRASDSIVCGGGISREVEKASRSRTIRPQSGIDYGISLRIHDATEVGFQLQRRFAVITTSLDSAAVQTRPHVTGKFESRLTQY